MKSNLVKLNDKAIKEHLALPPGFDPEVHEHRRLTLDRRREWYRVVCPDGHVHLVTPPTPVNDVGDRPRAAKPALGPITFECHVEDEGKHPAGTKFTITPETTKD